MRKLAIFRSFHSQDCPFGLPIIDGCKLVGNLVDNMNPDESNFQNNYQIFLWQSPGEKCKYADKIMEKNGPKPAVVDCQWSEEKTTEALRGSPLYYKMFSGTGVDGLFSLPMGFYAPTSIDTAPWYGMYSIESISSAKTTNKRE